MRILTVVTHPREDSLTFKVAKRFVEGLKDAGHETETLDLYRSNFDPMLWEKDEPKWSSNEQSFSSEVEIEMERLKKADALAFVFPLWWWSMPAMLKGYIDRVWNYGFAYGPNKLDHRHVLWLSLAGAPIERFTKRKYDEMMEHYFNVGLADYCGISSSKFQLLYETIDPKPGYMEDWLNQSYQLGLNYAKE
ncbi:Putative NADPH-quinone reductase (modulator of drug activity B) [Lentibacillus halodurans]|uniref:Putative NADPH-quinone reductase (Modulator of drug activity B) n=1 Tax=Lentibacillus halodurans TaxID=237679 RepID=A0A1I0ZYQ5_9BACI|nr:NAD(P)H oxidoreductase [Lentibacillus halodurans]SFB29243.1 Putative NADPH-quinone reductase (modulator of drug activity B) [Lentibacillus halodurans]